MVLPETFSTADLSYDSPPECLRLDILLVFSSFVQVAKDCLLTRNVSR